MSLLLKKKEKNYVYTLVDLSILEPWQLSFHPIRNDKRHFTKNRYTAKLTIRTILSRLPRVSYSMSWTTGYITYSISLCLWGSVSKTNTYHERFEHLIVYWKKVTKEVSLTRYKNIYVIINVDTFCSTRYDVPCLCFIIWLYNM